MFLVRVVFAMPIFYLAQQGLASMGYGQLGQIVLSALAMMVYSFSQRNFRD
jgi:hypothetical protein